LTILCVAVMSVVCVCKYCALCKIHPQHLSRTPNISTRSTSDVTTQSCMIYHRTAVNNQPLKPFTHGCQSSGSLWGATVRHDQPQAPGHVDNSQRLPGLMFETCSWKHTCLQLPTLS
jgi:hypothetical protein